jgi:uncharacterized protein
LKVVIDTNVVVSGLLRAEGVPATILGAIGAGQLQICYDNRIINEYREVLHRRHFAFDPIEVDKFVNLLEDSGFPVICEPLGVAFPDPDDAMFIETALASDAVCVVTGNTKHFPPDLCRGVTVITPRRFLDDFPVREQN